MSFVCNLSFAQLTSSSKHYVKDPLPEFAHQISMLIPIGGAPPPHPMQCRDGPKKNNTITILRALGALPMSCCWKGQLHTFNSQSQMFHETPNENVKV